MEQAILKALAKQRQDRFPDVAAFIAALQPRPVTQTSLLQSATIHNNSASSVHPAPSIKTKEQWLEEALLHHQTRRYTEALSACETAIQLDHSFAHAYNAKALALYHLQRYQEALKVIEQAIQCDASDATSHYGRGLILEKIRRYPEAVTAYEQASKLDPNYASARRRLIGIRSKFPS